MIIWEHERSAKTQAKASVSVIRDFAFLYFMILN